MNAFGALSFTLYPPHPAYNQLTKKNNILSVYQNGTLIGKYVPTYKRRVFNSGIEYKCKNIICLLDDYYYRATEFTGTASAFVQSVLSSYNAHVGQSYKIHAGYIHTASVEYEVPAPDTCWDALQTLVEKNQGYFVPRTSNGTIYLDYLSESDLPISEQQIVFGENMTDLFIETDTDNCYSVLYPFGTNEDDETVSIASVNGGIDYLENATAVAAYGRREKRMSWTNVESPSQLLSLAQAQLSQITPLFSESVQLSAVDLHDAGVNTHALFFPARIDCISAPHGYSHRYPITRMETVLDAPQSVSISLGKIPITFTDSFALERKKNASSRSGGGRAQAKAEKEFQRFNTYYEQTDEKFHWLATDSEWDELSQSGHVTAYTELTRTAHFVEDTAAMELPYDDWKVQWLRGHPEDAGLPDEELYAKYRAWITANPYAIYNSEYSDATRTERIISKTGINSLGQNETLFSKTEQTAEQIQSELYAADSRLGSYVSRTATSLTSAVYAAESSLSTYITQTATAIRSEIYAADSRLGSYISQTATSLTQAVYSAESSMATYINQTASTIRLEVYAADSRLGSYVAATATSISQAVYNAESGLRSSITQVANKVAIVVDGNNNIKAAQIVAAVNAAGSSVSISADTIDIDGIVSALTAKYVETAGLIANSIEASETLIVDATNVGEELAKIPNAIASFGTATSSGGQITIPTVTVDGEDGPSINFNIASTQFYLDAVEAAKLEGWNAACLKLKRVGNAIYGPEYGAYGESYIQHLAHYSASSHSYSEPWMKVNNQTYRTDKTVSLTNYTGNAQFNSGYDSYTASSFYWS